MAPRYIALIVATVIVLGAGVHLFRSVRAKPAQAEATGGAAPRAETPAPAAQVETPPVVAARPPMMGVPTPPPAPARVEVEEPKHAAETPKIASLVRPDDDTLEKQKANPKLDAAMAEANKAYDRSDYDEAKSLALTVLARAPNNVRMLRILVSASCLSGDAAGAQKHYLELPAGGPDRLAMKTRCSRDAGVDLKDQ
ncbi:MAG: hypothetical protein KIT31_08910 [Deltaproteobacteria bacterium]|nr:hypothetical protein [Deltaproteobacteria bacterium]